MEGQLLQHDNINAVNREKWPSRDCIGGENLSKEIKSFAECSEATRDVDPTIFQDVCVPTEQVFTEYLETLQENGYIPAEDNGSFLVHEKNISNSHELQNLIKSKLLLGDGSEIDQRILIIRNNTAHIGKKIQALNVTEEKPFYSVKTFEELRLHKDLLKGVIQMGFNKLSKIQETALPMLLADPPNNMIAQSPCGTGKTAAFTLAMLSRVDKSKPYPQALCLSPTLELALQTGKVLEKMGKFLDLKVGYAIPGQRPEAGTKCTDHIIMGTPGSSLDWIMRYRAFDPKKISIFVLDEADVLISQQGHEDQSIRIKRFLSPQCQLLLFSATYNSEVMQFANTIVPDAVIIGLRKKEEESLDNIKQFYVECDSAEAKYEALTNLYGALTIGQTMVFCHKKKSANWLTEKLSSDGHAVALLTGDLDIQQRINILNRFRDGKEKVLITTNIVAALVIDVEQVTMVINYDLPIDNMRRPDFETYLHRIGRTGRFGKNGLAINFVDGRHTLQMVQDISQHFSKPINLLQVDDLYELEKLNA